MVDKVVRGFERWMGDISCKGFIGAINERKRVKLSG